MSWLAEHAFSERSLDIAWKKVQKRESDDGNLAPSILKFQEEAEEKILRLSEALLDGSYKPYQFTEVDIETNGKERTLHIPAVQDRIVARAILATTTSRVDPLLGASAFGYRPGLGVADAVQAVVDAREAGLKWVLRTDVDDCFPSLSPDIAFDRFTQAVHDRHHRCGGTITWPNGRQRENARHNASRTSPRLPALPCADEPGSCRP